MDNILLQLVRKGMDHKNNEELRINMEEENERKKILKHSNKFLTKALLLFIIF